MSTDERPGQESPERPTSTVDRLSTAADHLDPATVQQRARGGTLTDDDLPPTDHLRVVPLAGGAAVYLDAPPTVGARLVGLADVTDTEALADGLRARGHGHGDLLHLPEIDVAERTVTYRRDPEGQRGERA